MGGLGVRGGGRLASDNTPRAPDACRRRGGNGRVLGLDQRELGPKRNPPGRNAQRQRLAEVMPEIFGAACVRCKRLALDEWMRRPLLARAYEWLLQPLRPLL